MANGRAGSHINSSAVSVTFTASHLASTHIRSRTEASSTRTQEDADCGGVVALGQVVVQVRDRQRPQVPLFVRWCAAMVWW